MDYEKAWKSLRRYIVYWYNATFDFSMFSANVHEAYGKIYDRILLTEEILKDEQEVGDG